MKVLPSVFEAKKKPPPPIPKAKGTPSVVGAKKKPPPPKPKKRSVTTGLGLAVDFLVELSPTLKSNIETLQKAGWTFELRADVGSYCSVDEKKIVCDIAHKGDEKRLVQTLAHESGHALYKMDPYVSPTGKTKDQYVEANVKRELKDEGEATLMNCRIRDELLKQGVDIGVAGASRDEYVKAYEACKDPTDPKQREKLRIQIGEIFRHGEQPSGEGGIDYGAYYAKPYAKFWDDNVAPKLEPPKKGGP